MHVQYIQGDWKVMPDQLVMFTLALLGINQIFIYCLLLFNAFLIVIQLYSSLYNFHRI